MSNSRLKDAGPDRAGPNESGLRRRFVGPGLGKTSGRGEIEAMVAIDDLFHTGKAPPEFFADLAQIVRRVAPFALIGLAYDGRSEPLVLGRTSDRSDALADQQEVRSILRAARDYFEERTSLDGYTRLSLASKYQWIALPLAGDDGKTRGAFALASYSIDVGARTVSFISFVARLLARSIADAVRAREVERRVEEVAASARAAVEARDRLLSTVSHDLKNPLGVILMSASLLLDQTAPCERRRAGRSQVEAIERNAQRMTRLISDLLDFGAIEAGSLSMSPRPCCPNALVEDTLADVAPAARAAGVALDVELPTQTTRVWADPDRIGQVLSNIAVNAIKFTPGGGRVVFRVRLLSSGHVSFAISDTGKGIAPEELPHIFERYWQSAPGAHAGSGLGLAICRSLVELSGGGIRAESTPGRGTTVTFSLPALPANVGGR